MVKSLEVNSKYKQNVALFTITQKYSDKNLHGAKFNPKIFFAYLLFPLIRLHSQQHFSVAVISFITAPSN